MSGSRILLSLMSALKNNKGKYGVASLCNGGGSFKNVIYIYFCVFFLCRWSNCFDDRKFAKLKIF